MMVSLSSTSLGVLSAVSFQEVGLHYRDASRNLRLGRQNQGGRGECKAPCLEKKGGRTPFTQQTIISLN